MLKEYSSGTVSKILWHFTGGPNWDHRNNRQYKELKKYDEAFDILKAIIISKELKISKYNEIVKVSVPEFKFNKISRQKEYIGRGEKIINASPICCLADIPIQHLNYHANRYGKFAIGFYRDSVIKNGFNPVLYSLITTKVVRSIYTGLTEIRYMDFENLRWEIDELITDIEEGTFCKSNRQIDESILSDLSVRRSELDFEINDLTKSKIKVEKSLQDFIALIKTFSKDEFSSVYCEREWRSLFPFKFNLSDVAMIVLPKSTGHYKIFCKEKLVSDIPIIPWEDLIES